MSEQKQETPEGRPVGDPAGEAVPARAAPTFKQFLETFPPDVPVIVVERASGPHKAMGEYAGGRTFFRLLRKTLT